MKVLIVDDNLVNRTLMSRLLARMGEHTAIALEDGQAALRWCDSNVADLVVVDYMMPGIDGLQFLERFRAQPSSAEVPVLMVTADTAREVRHRALRGGATDFLNKPVDHEEFCARVGNMLRLRAAQLELSRRAETLAVDVARATARIASAEHDTQLCLARAAEYRDPETGAHVLRMAHYSRLVAETLGLPAAQCELVFRAAPLHDVGKLGTPDSILLKAGRLSGDEFEVMKRHAEIGWEILRHHSSPVLQLGATIARTHHERYDGRGYPDGLAGQAIPIAGRIVAVADVFDALCADRPYKKAWPATEALEYLLAQRGAHLDAACVDALAARWDEVLDVIAQYRDDATCEPDAPPAASGAATH